MTEWKECLSWLTSEWESPYFRIAIRCQEHGDHEVHSAKMENPDTKRTQILRWGVPV